MAQPNWSYLDGTTPLRPNAPPGMGARMAAELPTVGKMVRGADGVLRAVGSFGATAARTVAPFAPYAAGALAVGGEALGVAEKANDPNASKLDVATRAAEGAGRLGSMAAGAGLGATAGSVFGPGGTAIGGMLGGAVGYVAPNAIYAARDWWANRGATPKAAPAAPAATAAPAAPAVPAGPAMIPGTNIPQPTKDRFGNLVFTGPDGRPDYGVEGPGGFTGMVTDDQGSRPATGFDAGGVLSRAERDAMIASGGMGAMAPGTSGDVSGTGTIQVGRGAVRTIDTRGAQMRDAAAEAESPRYPLGSVGSYVGAVMNQRRAASTEARKLAEEKLRVEGLGKGAAAAKATAEANQAIFQTAAARAHLAKNPGDYAGAAAAASGRALPRDSYSVPFPPMNDKDPVTVLNKGTGALERRQPTQPITFAQAVASAKKNGTYKSDAQVRADIARMPGYRLTD